MRLDVYLYENGFYSSRTKADDAIKRGEVFVDGRLAKKSSTDIKGDEEISIREDAKNFVSNGGYKLDKALDDFGISISGVCVDVGASTGGFTDCLLRRGAKKVYAVDVGESQLDKRLQDDERVTVIDNFNARNLSVESLGEKVDFAVCDVSFISLTYVLKPIYDVLIECGAAVCLIKPQFEVGKSYLGKSGIVTDRKAIISAVKKVYDYAGALGFTVKDFTNAPYREDKNKEYLIYLIKEKNDIKTSGKPFTHIENVLKK